MIWCAVTGHISRLCRRIGSNYLKPRNARRVRCWRICFRQQNNLRGRWSRTILTFRRSALASAGARCRLMSSYDRALMPRLAGYLSFIGSSEKFGLLSGAAQLVGGPKLGSSGLFVCGWAPGQAVASPRSWGSISDAIPASCAHNWAPHFSATSGLESPRPTQAFDGWSQPGQPEPVRPTGLVGH